MTKIQRATAITAGTIVFLLIMASVLVSIFADWFWFTEVGYLFVFKKVLLSMWGLGLTSGIIFFAFILLNITIARKWAPKYRVVFEEPALEKIRQFFTRWGRVSIVGISFLLSLLAGISAANNWDKLLLFLNGKAFNLKDPVFNIDVGYYVFRLPFLKFIYGWIAAMIFVTLIAIVIIHWLEGSIKITSRIERFAPHVKAHVSILLALFFVNIAWGYRLKMFDLLYSSRGAAFGASYADINANLPALYIMIFISAALSVAIIANIWLKGWRLPAIGVAVLVGTSLIAGAIYPVLVQQYRVRPNEIKLERPYIKRNIEFTKTAYGLNKVKKTSFNVQTDLTLADVQSRKATVENIRLWDWRPLKETYQQLQSIRPYYQFNDVDVDRYMLNGKKRQVTLGVRELGEPPDKTWLNEHLVFTHGYGVTMNQANEVTSEGLPNLLIKNLPPASTTNVNVKKPEIYFGENPENYAIVNSTEKELDYPKGDRNVYTRYNGSGGVDINSFAKRAIYSYYFSDVNILLTGAIKEGSRIMYNRNISERVSKIAPFLELDPDPYTVIDKKGRLYWIQDAYTTSSDFPYSRPSGEGYNYIRNSVKVVTDTYNGTVTLYDMGDDPIAKTYDAIFPGILTPFSKMPKDLKDHVRYPQHLFNVQAETYMTYHMDDPKVFYNKEDQWNLPKEKFSGQTQEIEPYYAILELPESKGDFLLITPFTPANKNNMIAWLSANSDPDKYGELFLYQFPKQELVFGPLQVESRIDQDPVISERFTLWGQVGSSVIRGNLLVIPVKNSLIYVEPIYLQSSESQIPELKRVVVAYSDRVAMEPTFEAALAQVFSGQPAEEQVSTQAEKPAEGSLIQQAKDAYNEAIKKQKEGDWKGYGEAIDRLGQILEKLK